MKANRTLILNALLIVVLFVSCYTPIDSYSPDQIIGTPIRIGRIEVAQNDFPKKMNWYDAVKACRDLGNGWRLPTKYELNLMCLNKDKIGGFVNGGYWSSTELDANFVAWIHYFYVDYTYIKVKYIISNVRAVRAF